MRNRIACALGLCVLAVTVGDAVALVPIGTKMIPVVVYDVAGRTRTLPDPRLPAVVFYEDKDSGAQNARARVVVGQFTDRIENRGKFDFIPIADVEKWNWWPARKYVLSEVAETAKNAEFPVLLDWKGDFRRAYHLTKGKSGVLLIATDGRLLFAAEGTLTDEQLKQIVARLVELGAVH